MRLLILGGTGFVGRAIALEALARGHHVTLLNRGSSTKTPLEGTVALVGDRLAGTHQGYAALSGLSFDAVVDTWSGDDASVVSGAMTALRGRVGHYTYISSVSAHDPPPPPSEDDDNDASSSEDLPPLFNEDTPLYDVDKPGAAETNPYAHAKRSGEIAALSAEDGDVPVLIVRPGVILGPHERLKNGARLPWWLARLHRGGPTLAPGPRDAALQVVDVRDLAAFVVGGAERKLQGAFVVNGDEMDMTMERFLECANEITGRHADLKWVEPEHILEADVAPWVELPLWLPPEKGGKGRRADVYNWDVARAKAAGLKLRPLADTIRDTWAWMGNGGPEADGSGDPLVEPVIGLSPEKEAKVLLGWNEV